ncbi:hypothetical protein C8R44DRAFT_888528 [Mycena epipterygia]|nr:hypothetical protein C8R44DRAFT_888528 [Mycena epipterygia]
MLLGLYAKAAPQSQSTPTEENPESLTATCSVQSTICARHVFEQQLLPEAIREGWKTEINFSEVQTRLILNKHIFQELVDDIHSKPGGPRDQSIFWTQAIENHRNGLADDIRTFKYVQVGYYGELGREEAIKTMYASSSYGIHMFPDESSEEGDEMTA